MNEFEKACSEVEKDRNYEYSQENAIEWIRNSNVATVTFSQGRYISKIKKLAEKYPEEVQITAENKDGSIVAHIPVSYIKINNLKREISDEKREVLRERARNIFHTDKNTDETP